MASVTTAVVLDGEDTTTVRAHPYNSPVIGEIVIASVDVNGVTIQSHEPGALRRLAEALLAAEEQAEALRSKAAAA